MILNFFLVTLKTEHRLTRCVGGGGGWEYRVGGDVYNTVSLAAS